MNTLQIRIEELRELQAKSARLRAGIDEMKRFLNDFSSSPAAQEILAQKEALKKELAQLPSYVTCCAQNIKNRKMAIECRVLVEQRKKKKREFVCLMQGFSKALAKSNRKKMTTSVITCRCLEQILEVAEFGIDSMVLSLQSQIHGDEMSKYVAEQRMQAIPIEMEELQQRFRQAKKFMEDRLQVWESMLEETTKEIFAWLGQSRDHVLWTVEHDPLHKQDAIAWFRKRFPEESLEGIVEEIAPEPVINGRRPHARSLPENLAPEPQPEEPKRPWKFFFTTGEESQGVEMPYDRESFCRQLAELLAKAHYLSLKNREGIVFDKLMTEAQRIDAECSTSRRIKELSYKHWIKTKVDRRNRMAIDPDENMRHLRFILYPKKFQKRALA